MSAYKKWCICSITQKQMCCANSVVGITMVFAFQCAGVVWPSQGKSVTKFAEDLAAVEQRPLAPVVSLFNGIFFGLFMSSQIIGNQISAAVLGKVSSWSFSSKTNKEIPG